MFYRNAVVQDVKGMVATHYAAVRSISLDVYSLEVLSSWSPTPNRERVEKLSRVIRTAKTHCIIAEVPKFGITGFAIFDMDYRVLEALYVNPVYSGKGLGSNLLFRIEEHAITLGIETLYLKASINAVSFYRGKGYIGVRESSQELGDGQYMASMSMEKQFHGSL